MSTTTEHGSLWVESDVDPHVCAVNVRTIGDQVPANAFENLRQQIFELAQTFDGIAERMRKPVSPGMKTAGKKLFQGALHDLNELCALQTRTANFSPKKLDQRIQRFTSEKDAVANGFKGRLLKVHEVLQGNHISYILQESPKRQWVPIPYNEFLKHAHEGGRMPVDLIHLAETNIEFLSNTPHSFWSTQLLGYKNTTTYALRLLETI